MDIDFWLGRWREGRTGFHQGRPNEFLAKHVERLGSARRILVPLAGKAEDMAFLAGRGHDVVGVEVVEDAVRAFFAEHELEPTVTEGERGRTYRAAGVTLICADFFALQREDVGALTAFYDRAALVALPPDVRPRYVRHLRSLLAPDVPKVTGLLVTFDYRQGAMSGPPFAVGDDEVRALYEGATVELLGEGVGESPRFQEAGVTPTERCYAIGSAARP
jgi:thiopurine S-methyltransferase